jgi:pimeloyl-ACP methyl ester carboxylesterase
MELTKYLERPEGKVAYSDTGTNGEPVVMLPGLGALRSEYRFLAPALHAAGYRAVTVNLRGQGQSSVPWPKYNILAVGSDILALIDQINAGSAYVIATFFSPGAAVWAAVERPNAIRSLVLIRPSVRETKLSPLMTAAVWVMMNNPWRVHTWAMYYHSLYPIHKPADFEDYLDQLRRNLAQPGRFEAAKAMTYTSRRPAEERLNKVKVPVLVVMGTKDPDFSNPAGEAEHIARQTRGKVVLIEGAGHYPQTEMPGKTAKLVIEFLKGIKDP